MGGAYLSRPVKDKVSEDGSNAKLSYGVSCMQGWRLKQEDAHNCIVEFDENTSLFGVYDGHGGFEVAKYTSDNFPNFLRTTDDYKRQNYKEALIEAFLGFDDTIPTPEVLNVLQEMVKANNGRETEFVGNSTQAGCSSSQDEYDEDLETPESLRADANKSIEEVMASYHIPTINKLKSESMKPTSHLRGRREQFSKVIDRARSSSAAGCSSSSKKTPIEVATSISNRNESRTSSSGDSNSSIIRNQETNTDGNEITRSESSLNGTASPLNGNVNVNDDSIRNPVEKSCPKKKMMCEKPGTSKKKKLAFDDLDDNTAIKNFITNDEIAEEDEEDSEDETFQPKEGALDSNDDDEDDDNANNAFQLPKNSLAKIFSKCLERVARAEYDDDDDDDSEEEDDDSSKGENDTTDEENAHTSETSNSEDLDEHKEEEEEDDLDEVNLEDESVDDSESDEEKMTCEMLSSMSEKPGIDSGCTAVVALLKGRNLYVANAGDSRCIVCKAGQAIDMSDDHKPEDELERKRIVKAGGCVTADGRVNGGLNLSRAIGDHCYKTNTDLPNTEQMITALPDVRTMKLEPDVEFLILACDGIWNSMTSQEVVDFVRPKILENMGLSNICEQLFDKCLAPDTWGDGTGCDNMTCIIVKPFHSEVETQSIASNATVSSNDKTNSIDASGDATPCELNGTPDDVTTMQPVKSTIQNDDDRKNLNIVPTTMNEQISNGQMNVSSTSTARKRNAEEAKDNFNYNKRQKTDDAIVETNASANETS